MPGVRFHHRGEVAGDVDVRALEHAQVLVDLDPAVVTGWQLRIGYKLRRLQPARPDEHTALNQLAVGEPEAVLGRGGDHRVRANLDAEVGKNSGSLLDELR